MGMSSTSFGNGKKRERVNDEIEMSAERRRSSRIVALEEKRQKEKQRKLALASAKKQKIIETKNKEKGKAVIDDSGNDHLDHFVESEKLGPTDKGWKDRAFFQLISIFKAIQEGRPTNDESTSLITNVSSLNTVPDKHVLESVIDFLQRKDSDELFGDPICFNTVENCHLNVNEPMDFGTMRAKIHDGMYTTLEQFKRDVYLICFNGMNAYPSTSRYYKVAKGIGCHAIKIFESLSADPEHFDSKVGFNKRQYCKKPAGDRKLGTPRLVRDSTKPTTGKNGTHYKAAKTDKRVMYQPPNNNSLVSEVLNCINKSNLQLNTCTSNYKDSLLRFVKDLGPIAQSVAAKKIEAFNSQQLQDTNTSNPNLHENALTPQITHQLTPRPQALKQPITHNSSQKPFQPLQIITKPLTIPGIATHQNRNANNTIPSNVNIRNNTDRGKNLFINNNCQSYAAALMYNSVYNNNEKGKNQIGVESSNARGTMDTTSYALNGNMSSRVDNMFDYIRHQNTSALSNSGSSSNVPTYVHPSRTIPILRPQLQSNPLNLIPSNRFSRPFQIPQARPIMSSMSSSRLGVMSQPRPQNSLPSIFENNNFINSSLVYPMGYSRPMNSMFGMNMHSSESLLNSQAANQFPNEQEASLFCLNTPYHPGDFQALMNSSDFNNNSSRRMQITRRMNPLGPSSSIEFNNNLHPMQVNNQMMNLGPSSSSNFQIPFLNGALYYNGGRGALQTQQERANLQLLDNDYGQANFTLGL